jgi:demethylmenaquinone methyltransferase/2-methoxy-6-polyprenyl-1,4-benzoquinol methylase
MNSDLINYYSNRAKEYEKIYAKPERQNDILKATEILQSFFTGKDVLEIACGTGYWTERIAQTAKAILATDINESVIEVARSKSYAAANVRFEVADLYHLPNEKEYESIYGGFIWSHIPLLELENFLHTIHKHIISGGTVVFMDNHYVEGSSLPITEKDEQGNTYQTRRLENGSMHKVLKNFPTKSFIMDLLKDKANEVELINLEYYWILKYITLNF